MLFVQTEPTLDDDAKLLYNVHEAAKLLSLSPHTLTSWRSRKTGPAYVHVGGRVYYPREDLVAWINAMPRFGGAA